MNTYYIIWTYVANYGMQTVHARDPEEACAKLVRGFSDDFAAKGQVLVFDKPPAIVREGTTIHIAPSKIGYDCR